jgi:ribosomal protein S18 acetylase RimI-like enzyme
MVAASEEPAAMDEALTLRVACAEDAESIRALTDEAYAPWIAVIGAKPRPMTVDYQDAVRKHRFDLLYVGDRLAALIETVADGDNLLIENVAVRPAFQHRGFGRRLLALAEELALSSQRTGVRLYTHKLYTRNIQLYASLGYVIEREEERSIGIAVHMRKQLAP